MSDLRVMGRTTQGVKIVNLKEDDTLMVMQKLTGIVMDTEDEQGI